MNNAFMEFFNDEFICGSQKSGQDDDPSIKSAYKTFIQKKYSTVCLRVSGFITLKEKW